MAIDIWLINSGNPINNYSSIVNYPAATGIVYTGRVNNTLTIDQIDDKFTDRFDDPRYYSGDAET